MTEPQLVISVAPVLLPKPAAAAALGMSVDSFDRYAAADLRCVRRGRLRLYPITELERWANDNAVTADEDERAAA